MDDTPTSQKTGEEVISENYGLYTYLFEFTNLESQS